MPWGAIAFEKLEVVGQGELFDDALGGRTFVVSVAVGVHTVVAALAAALILLVGVHECRCEEDIGECPCPDRRPGKQLAWCDK